METINTMRARYAGNATALLLISLLVSGCASPSAQSTRQSDGEAEQQHDSSTKGEPQQQEDQSDEDERVRRFLRGLF